MRCPPVWTLQYIDPPLGRAVTTPEMARKVRELDTSTLLDNPVNLADRLAGAPLPQL